jgi:hypothetical protein
MRRSPWRMRLCARCWQRCILKIGKGEIEGMKHVATLPTDKHVIVATTHVSDADVGVAVNALADHLNLGIANQSIHHTWQGDWLMYLTLRLIDKECFFPVDFARIRNRIVGSFNPDNYLHMAEAMTQRGISMLVPAHSPCFTGKLPNRGGFGAVYLGQISNSVILPVAVDVEYRNGKALRGISFQNLLRKPITVRTIIGEPIQFSTIRNIEDLPLLTKHKVRSKAADIRYHSIHQSLLQQSDELMRKLATLLPYPKRGKWR